MEISAIPLLNTSNPSFICAWKPNSDEFLEGVIKIFDNNPLNHQKIGVSEIASTKSKTNKKMVSGLIANFDLNNNKVSKSEYECLSIYTNFLDNCFKSYANRWEFSDYDLIGLSPPNVQIVNLKNIDKNNLAFNYMKREGKFIQTSFSYITILSNPSNLSKIEFYYQGISIKAVKGLTLIWPSDWTHSNRIYGSKDNNDFYFITGTLGHFNLNEAKVGMSFDSVKVKQKNYKEDK
tara:strand:- start:475 stop:1179 length:705 start_codon:yes stop_codon:yes gene_type:complete